MKHAHKILIYTASIVLVASTSLWLILDNYFGQNEINSDNIASKSNTSETEITSSSPNSHDHGPVNTPTAFNEFQPIFIILTLALCMMSEFNNTAIIKYELTDASVLRRKNKSQKLTEIKQTLLFLSNSFINLLVMLLLCHYFSVLFIWACLGKFIGYFIFNSPVKRIEDKMNQLEDDVSTQENQKSESQNLVSVKKNSLPTASCNQSFSKSSLHNRQEQMVES